MQAFARRHCLLLLLILVISQISLAVHATEHLDSQEDVCQLCHARDDNASVIPPVETSLQNYYRHESPQVAFNCDFNVVFPALFRARAPPHFV